MASRIPRTMEEVLADFSRRITTLERVRSKRRGGSGGGSGSGFASEAERDAAIPNPVNDTTVYRTDRLWWETYFDQTKVATAGWYPVRGALPRLLLTARSQINPPVNETWGTPAAQWTARSTGGLLFNPPSGVEHIRASVAGEYQMSWRVSVYNGQNVTGSGKIFVVRRGAIPNGDLSGNALVIAEDENSSNTTHRRWMQGSITHTLAKDEDFRYILFANASNQTFNHAAPFSINQLLVEYVRPPFIS